MQLIITFLEGLISFISPCVLPMLPVYMLYFAAGEQEKKKTRAVINALGFVLGFTAVFMLLGVFASALGTLVTGHRTAVNIVTGSVVVLFGLFYSGIIKVGFLSKTIRPDTDIKPKGFFSSVFFGAVFSVGWSPCTGAFLGSAVMLASQSTHPLYGVLLLLTYSLGLGVPFVLCAVLIDSLKGAFDFIKKHYKSINIVCGVFLIIIGILMMTGVMNSLP